MIVKANADKLINYLHASLLQMSVRFIPARWLYDVNCEIHPYKTEKNRLLQLEIVSHCWQYAPFLYYQLSSIVAYPPKKVDLKVSIFYSREDKETVRLLEHFRGLKVKNVVWNFRELAKESLFRRSIGRNIAALQSVADWIWFTDCDSLFLEGCLDSLPGLLDGEAYPLVFPLEEQRTNPLQEKALTFLDKLPDKLDLADLENLSFIATPISRASGPLQITRGEVARKLGYCKDVSVYQTSAITWQKCKEDRIFRWLLGTPGRGIAIERASRIQHVEKGRYAGRGSAWMIVKLFFQKLKLRTWKYFRGISKV